MKFVINDPAYGNNCESQVRLLYNSFHHPQGKHFRQKPQSEILSKPEKIISELRNQTGGNTGALQGADNRNINRKKQAGSDQVFPNLPALLLTHDAGASGFAENKHRHFGIERVLR